ncbi:hypothetical protein PLICRDRAFT_507832 [Plicaturopsis crispa FD-325 SS-3]|nr:hypothetical protein PLICRDRAFT_507832 [Plicaturopsis crispa FD-325 SS-3]
MLRWFEPGPRVLVLAMIYCGGNESAAALLRLPSWRALYLSEELSWLVDHSISVPDELQPHSKVPCISAGNHAGYVILFPILFDDSDGALNSWLAIQSAPPISYNCAHAASRH